MALGYLSQYADDVGIGRVFRQGVEDAVWRNNELLGLTINGQPLFPELPAGDSSYRWKLNTAGNTSAAVFAEGQAAPVPVAQTYANLALAYVYYWCWIRMSGHALDVLENRSDSDGIDTLSGEIAGGMGDLTDVVNTTSMGATNSGLEVAVDDDATYAGQARGSAAWFEPTDTNHNGALTRAGLLNVHEAARDNDKGGKPSVILTAHNQVTNYIQLTGEPNAQNSSVRFEFATIGGGRLDVAPSASACTFMGLPIVPLGDWTDTVFIALDTRQTKFGPNVGLSFRRRFRMDGPIQVGDDRVWELSTALVPVVHMPKFCFKLEGVTA